MLARCAPFVALLLVACSGGKSGGDTKKTPESTVGRCDYSMGEGAQKFCDEYKAELTTAKALCMAGDQPSESTSAKWTAAPCSATGRIAKCVTDAKKEADGGSTLGATRHYYAPYTATTAKEDCDLNEGAFTAG